MPDSEESLTPCLDKKIFEAIENNDPVLLKALLTERPQNVNVLDENKMTPLQHAAYKGNKEVVQILLDQSKNFPYHTYMGFEHERILKWEQYKVYQNRFVNLSKQKIKAYCFNQKDLIRNNSKLMWESLKNLVSNKSKGSSHSAIKFKTKNDTALVQGKIIIADKFYTFYVKSVFNIERGADVKLCEHQHNYTALHFGALSGNIDVSLALLMAGAKSTETNTVGRTPAQMAAFVGHHDCVAIINNFVPKEELEYYTYASGTQSTPYLPPFLLKSFHKFIMQINIHPIKIVININNLVGLQDHLPEVKKVLELMSEKEMKRGAETNEVMSFKFHYLSYIVGEIIKLKQRQSAKKEDEAAEDDKRTDITEIFSKKLLKPGKDDNLEFMDGFLKECIREFPFRESTLFRQMVTTLSGEDPPAPLFVISSVINGQRGFLDNIPHCNTCGEEKPTKKCSKCKIVQYCDRNCQRLHWPWHKKSCTRLSQENAEASKSIKGGSEAQDIDIKELQNYLVKN